MEYVLTRYIYYVVVGIFCLFRKAEKAANKKIILEPDKRKSSTNSATLLAKEKSVSLRIGKHKGHETANRSKSSRALSLDCIRRHFRMST